jgi:hypothetical protein
VQGMNRYHFFKRAFGDTFRDYERILLMPHDYIFNREWYERFDAQDRLGEHQAEFAKLTAEERAQLVALLSSCEPREFGGLSAYTPNRRLKRMFRFYIPTPKDELFAIWAKQKELTRGELTADMELAEDEHVEDAGLDGEEGFVAVPPVIAKRTKGIAA